MIRRLLIDNTACNVITSWFIQHAPLQTKLSSYNALHTSALTAYTRVLFMAYSQALLRFIFLNYGLNLCLQWLALQETGQ